MTKYYFFKTVKDGSRQRLRPLSGQTDARGASINPSFNTQASRAMRGSYPIGTVFCSPACELNNGYYSAGDLYPMALALGDYREASHIPTADMNRAYADYRRMQEESFPTLFDSFEEPVPVKKDRRPKAKAKTEAPAAEEPVPAVNC